MIVDKEKTKWIYSHVKKLPWNKINIVSVYLMHTQLVQKSITTHLLLKLILRLVMDKIFLLLGNKSYVSRFASSSSRSQWFKNHNLGFKLSIISNLGGPSFCTWLYFIKADIVYHWWKTQFPAAVWCFMMKYYQRIKGWNESAQQSKAPRSDRITKNKQNNFPAANTIYLMFYITK